LGLKWTNEGGAGGDEGGVAADGDEDTTSGSTVSCATVADTVVDDNDDIEGGAMAGCLTVTEDDATDERAMPFDFVGAAGKGEGGCGGRASLGCTAVFVEVEAERSIRTSAMMKPPLAQVL
jgi:hypothetical protein